MTVITPEIVRGDLKPALRVLISDARSTANFAAITADQVLVVGEMNGAVIFSTPPTEYIPADDGKSATVVREWGDGDTDVSGRLWVSIIVMWAGTSPQTFPNDGPLRIDVTRAAGDA